LGRNTYILAFAHPSLTSRKRTCAVKTTAAAEHKIQIGKFKEKKSFGEEKVNTFNK
jgi:hypothetical protein